MKAGDDARNAGFHRRYKPSYAYQSGHKMKAAVLHEIRHPLRIEEVATPKPGEGEVLIKVEASGVCHSDLHLADGDWPDAIAREIQVTVSPKEATRLADARPVNPEAYEAYQRGIYTRRSGFGKEILHRSLAYFQKAIEKDPSYAPAYARLADTYIQLGGRGYVTPESAYAQARKVIVKALELDGTLSEAHSALGWYKLWVEWDWAGAESEFQRALSLDTNSVRAYAGYNSYLVLMGRFDEGIAASVLMLERDPLPPHRQLNLGWTYFNSRQYDRSIEQLQKTLSHHPKHPMAHLQLAWNYGVKGMYEDAVAECDKTFDLLSTIEDPVIYGTCGWVYGSAGRSEQAKNLLESAMALSKQGRDFAGAVGLAHIGLGNYDRAFEWLNNAYEERSTLMPFLKILPMFDPLRDDPRFQDLLRRMNFSE